MSRTPSSGRSLQQSWSLLSGEDTYAGQNAQDPRTSRKMQSWIPQDDGQLHRELVEPTYLPTTLSGPVVGLYQFVQNVGNGAVTRTYFAAARTDFTVGTKTCNFYVKSGSAWAAVSAVGTLVDAPMCVTQQDNFFLSDGASNWLYDGSIWVNTGFSLLPGIPQNTSSSTFPEGTNGPAIKVSQGTAPPVLISGSVQQKYKHSLTSGSNGAFGYYFPQTSFDATATGTCILFNPPQMGSGTDPNVQPMQQAVVDTSGAITGYTVPDSGATTDYAMMLQADLVIPVAGNYTVQINHDDALIWGISNGHTTGLTPSASGPSLDLYNHAGTALNNYGASGGGVLCGGTNKAGNYSETFNVNFPKADTYTVELNYTQHINSQQLTFYMAPVGQTLKFPYTGTGSTVGGFSASVGRQYWITMADETAGVATESSSSSPSATTGPINFATVNVYPTGGHFSCTSGSKTVTVATDSNSGVPWSDGSGSEALLSAIVGKTLWINGTKIGVIQSYTVSGTLNYLATITLVANSGSTITSGYAVIADARTTHWHLYASESDGSKIGQYLASVPVTQNLSSSPYTDSSPFLDDVTNSFLPIFRPVRNDAPPPSRLLEVHKVRQWRRREATPNFFNFTANEEVTSGDNGDPTQCVPGADAKTISDMVNEVSFPDQSARLRGLVSHTDALYMFSEKQCYPLYGQSVDDFAISQVVAFSLGLAGRFAARSTPHGLAFVSYDRRVFLYPSSPYSTYLAQSGSATSALKEIGRPMRNKFLQIDPTRLDEVVVEFYHFGIRDWLAVSFPLVGGTYQCYIYDFNTAGWFQIQRGFASLAAFEVSEGNIVLIGGAADGKTYVIDDQTGTYTTTGTLPQATFRPALIDFGDPAHAHIFRLVELEFSSAAMAKDITVTYWLDPNDVDNPGVGKTLALRSSLGANRFRGFPEGGATCQRMLLEVKAAASTHTGVIRGLKLVADTAAGNLPANQVGTV
jgi:hypothetical protein